MQKINFKNLPNQTTPINATNLNALQDNVDNAKEDKMTNGTWTPTINTMEGVAPTVTYTTQKGSYKKIGNMIFIEFFCTGKITALNGTNNYGIVRGLPFLPKSYSVGECAISDGACYNISSQTGRLKLLVNKSWSGSLYIYSENGVGAASLKVSGDNDFQIGGSGWYETE